MFDKLKKKSIEIICPACRGGQTEPALAFSTYCRTCGEHLKIVKGIARLAGGPQLSGISTIRVVSDKVTHVEAKTEPEVNGKNGKNGSNGDSSEAWVKTKKRPEQKKERRKGKRKRAREDSHEKPKVEADKKKQEVVEEIVLEKPKPEEPLASVAEVFGLTQAADSEPVEDEKDKTFKSPSEILQPDVDDYELREGSITLGDDAQAYEDLTEGSMGAMISDLIEQEEKREQAKASSKPEKKVKAEKPAKEPKKKPVDDTPLPAKEAPAPKKPVVTKKTIPKNQIRVRCFRCNHRQYESKFAESTQCGRCNTYISLSDYHIRQPTDRVIRTRGNVTVHRKGSLIGSELACRDLLAMGTISTKVDCSGEARFKYSATVNGNLHCETLIIEKGTIVEFSEGVFSESVKIYGTLRGDVTCAGLVEVTRTGILDGDVIARGVDLNDGGTLTGEMAIDPDLKVKLPEVKGYDPSIID